jgi:NitT/TauT family transport system permease protein
MVFLMAAEMLTVGQRDFRLLGLGAYLQEAANQSDLRAIAWGIGMLMGLIVVFDQVVWRPLLAWSARFKLEMVAQGELPSSWFYRALRSSRLVAWWAQVVRLAVARLDRALMPSAPIPTTPPPARRQRAWATYALGALAGGVLLYGVSRAIEMLLRLSVGQWLDIALAVGATCLRVAAALAWTVPLGVVIGTRPRLAAAGGANRGLPPGHGPLPRHLARGARPARRHEPGRRGVNADGDPVVSAV